ncbi:error-prone DNA polymerase [Anaeromyxobacter paludicola]|uniref:DNA polymerase III subunit alpha n=1 Tax=Anaeromyxobacter paludicola TaxID=2918171 RepID=A0ABM7X7E2_9BACT|nr:error-prone DNA polymerase [Anaeromyxobacter paludicola]BDG07746.1 error-prone DNA polymerase [Anaeromyxobacter paludicola]
MTAKVRYAELRCRSSFSFLRGASQPEELVERAAALGLSALALADRFGLYGAVRAHAAAKACGLPLLVGAEVACDGLGPVAGGAAPLVLLAVDREGYAGLCRLLTRAHCGACPPGESPRRREEPTLSLREVAEAARGLFALYPGADAAGAERLRDAFGRRLALAVSRHHVAGEEVRIAAARAVGRRLGIPVAVVNDVHTHERRRQPLQDVLTCVRLGVTVSRAGRRLFPNAERTLKGPEEMARLWADFPEGLEQAAEIAERCRFRLDEVKGEHPLPPVELEPAPLPDPPDRAADAARALGLLRRLVEDGVRWRYPDGVPADVRRQLARELELVGELGYASYFLTVWDIVRFARSRGILCQGRGSAANSAVCFVLGITSIDPVRMGLLFERFISAERGEPPDIDVDFEHERREEVLQYVYERYGRDRAGMVCEVISYRARSALRDVGKALGLSLAQVDRLSKLVGSFEGLEAVTPELLAQAGLDPRGSPAVRQALALAGELCRFPRHLSIHVGGFLVTRRPLCETAPIEPAAMEGRTVVQWDKDDVAELGLLKVDLLGLGMLTALSRCLALLARHRPRPARDTPVPHPEDLARIPAEAPAVYEMIQRADTIGVFQIESRAQMSMLPRLKPARFYDLVISVAIIRPGPIQGGMIHPFLRRRDGLEEVRYPYPPLRAVLGKTLGVPLFQEQAMRLAVVAAGFTPGEADELRRTMTHKRSHERMAQLKARLLSGMAERGISPAEGEEIYRQLLGFAGYGFPESHAASFALLVYASAWLKCHHPAAFTCALLDSQPMGFYAPHTLVEDARRHGVEVRGVDVRHSGWECGLEGPAEGAPAAEGEAPALRLGLSRVRGLPRAVGEAVVAARLGGPFASVGDLARRAGLSRAWLSRLAEAGALRGLGGGRREALWQALGVDGTGGGLLDGRAPPEGEARLEPATAAEEVAQDFARLGLSERAHPVSLLRPALARRGVRSAQELLRAPGGAWVEVAGLVIVRQRPMTASGLTFVSLEDETGIANLVVMPDVYERFRAVVRGEPFVLARGRVERNGRVVNVKVRALEPLALAPAVPPQARDFR